MLGLLGFIFVLPIASDSLSGPQFTLWLFGNSILAIGIIFETSVSVVFTRTLTTYLERTSLSHANGPKAGDDRAAGFICTSFILYVVVGIIGSLASVLAGNVSLDGLIAIGLDPTEAHLTLLAFAAISCSSVLLSFGRSVLIADQQMRVQRVVMLLTTVAKLFVSAAIFATLARVDLAMAAIALLNVAEWILVAFLSWPVQKQALKTRPSLSVMDEFSIPFIKTFLIRIGGYLTMYSSSIIVVRYVPTDADAFLLSFRFAQAAAAVSMIPVSISLPALTRLRARIEESQQPPAAFVEAALRVIVLAVSCMLLMLLGLLIVAPIMLDMATSGQTLLGGAALAYLCLIFLLESHHVAHAMVYETQNRVPFLGISIVSGVAMLCLTTLLVPHFGIWGALIGLNLVQMSANNWVPVWLNLRQWGLSWTTYLGIAVRMGVHPSPSKVIDPDA